MGFAVCAFGQLVEVGIIDDFFIGANIQKAQVTLSADLPSGGTPIVADSSFPEGSDFSSTCNIDFGEQGRSFDSEIFTISGDELFRGEWVVANPKTSSSVATLQYDGNDQSFNLNESGLNNFDLTFGGTATEFRLSIVSDLETAYTTIVYTSSGTCSAVINVPRTPANYNYADTFFDLQYSAFSGGCTFSNVGAIELVLPSTDAVDAIVRKIAILGVLPSPSPTPTPAPSQSNTPTPGPSQSNTPAPSQSNTPAPSQSNTPTPSNSPPCIRVCQCPSFTCQLAYDLDDNYNTLSYYTSAFVFDDSDNIIIIYEDDDGNTSDDVIIYYYIYDDYTPIDTNSFTTIETFSVSSFTSLFSSFTSLFSSFTSLFDFTLSSFTSLFTSFSTRLTITLTSGYTTFSTIISSFPTNTFTNSFTFSDS